MSISETYRELLESAWEEFDDVVVSGEVLRFPTGDPHKLRLDIVDGSLLDVFLSPSGRYAYHWERRLTKAGSIFRHDNAPHHRWRYVSTFPKHFHNGSEGNVTESYISDIPNSALQEVLRFVRQTLLREAES